MMKYNQGRYILDENGNPKPESDVMAWTEWIENRENTNIAFDWCESSDGDPDLYIATTFLGEDKDQLGSGEPILFETRVWDNDATYLVQNYATKAAALEGHKAALEKFTVSK